MDAEIEDLTERCVQVVFLIGPDSPPWAESKRDQVYTYIDPSRSVKVGDIVTAGMYDSPAQVVALGKGNYVGQPYAAVTSVLEKRWIRE